MIRFILLEIERTAISSWIDILSFQIGDNVFHTFYYLWMDKFPIKLIVLGICLYRKKMYIN